MSSVFVNRLKQGMRLQTDPAVIYGITKGDGAGARLAASELSADTPYNTYLIGPAARARLPIPGRASIEAALNPDFRGPCVLRRQDAGPGRWAMSLPRRWTSITPTLPPIVGWRQNAPTNKI